MIDCQPQFHRDSKQPDNRNYARTFVDGQYPDSHYLDHTPATVGPEIDTVFNFNVNIYLIVIDNSINAIGLDSRRVGGVGGRSGKSGGSAWVSGGFQ